MEETFSRVYGSELVKVGIEQALFPAIYQFSLKEPEHAVVERLEKYRNFFMQAAIMSERFSGLLKGLFPA